MELISIIIIIAVIVIGFSVVKEQLVKNKNEKIIKRRKSDKEREKL